MALCGGSGCDGREATKAVAARDRMFPPPPLTPPCAQPGPPPKYPTKTATPQLSPRQGSPNTRSREFARDASESKNLLTGRLEKQEKSAGNTLRMLPSRLPDLPPEIWEYILLFVPEPAINDIKLVSHARGRGSKGRLRILI